MEKIVSNNHPLSSVSYAFSRMLERIVFYGIRSMLYFFLLDQNLNFTQKDYFSIIANFTIAVGLSQFLGALLGDLLIGNKRAILVGGVLQALGAFCFCIPSTTVLYLGMTLVILGNGLYSPNLISNFGKQYLNNTKLLDAGFTFFYLLVNIGAFLGGFVFVLLGKIYSWNVGFILCGICMILSTLLIFLSKEKEVNMLNFKKLELNKRISKLTLIFVFIGIFWAIYQVANIQLFEIRYKLIQFSNWDLFKDMSSNIDSFFTFIVGIVFIFLWSFYYFQAFIKLLIALVLSIIPFGILLFIPEFPSEQHIVLFVISMGVIALAKTHVEPLIHTTLTKYTNPKYLAIFISFSFIPTFIFSFSYKLYQVFFEADSSYALPISLLAMVCLTLGILLILWRKKKLVLTTE